MYNLSVTLKTAEFFHTMRLSKQKPLFKRTFHNVILYLEEKMLHSERYGVPMIHASVTCIKMNLPEMENIKSFAFSLLAGFTVFFSILTGDTDHIPKYNKDSDCLY